MDDRDRRDRTEIENANWALQIDRLVAAYLNYCMLHEDQQPILAASVAEQEEPPGPPLVPLDLVDLFGELCCHSESSLLSDS
jgi:hypothetical protein